MPKVISIELRADHSNKVLASIKKNALIALESIGQEAERYAKEDCPVDTGRLRSSITHEVHNSEQAVYIGTNVEYAVYQEYGDYQHTVGKKHFLRDAAANHGDKYIEILAQAIK